MCVCSKLVINFIQISVYLGFKDIIKRYFTWFIKDVFPVLVISILLLLMKLSTKKFPLIWPIILYIFAKIHPNKNKRNKRLIQETAP